MKISHLIKYALIKYISLTEIQMLDEALSLYIIP